MVLRNVSMICLRDGLRWRRHARSAGRPLDDLFRRRPERKNACASAVRKWGAVSKRPLSPSSRSELTPTPPHTRPREARESKRFFGRKHDAMSQTTDGQHMCNMNRAVGMWRSGGTRYVRAPAGPAGPHTYARERGTPPCPPRPGECSHGCLPSSYMHMAPPPKARRKRGPHHASISHPLPSVRAETHPFPPSSIQHLAQKKTTSVHHCRST